MKIGIVGAGQMGKQLAIVFSALGDVVLISRDISKADAELKRSLRLAKRSSFISEVGKFEISLANDYSDLSSCELVIEAVSESLKTKQIVLKQIVKHVMSSCVIGTNTSTLSITALSMIVADARDRFIGCHFFNPATGIPLVEIVMGEHTSDHAKTIITDLLKDLNFSTIKVNETPGFIVNRALFLMLNESICMLDEKVACVDDIDNAFKVGLSHPMGPLTLCDFIGLDTCLSILTTLKNEFGETKYRPSKLLVKKVRANKLGRKTGEGFRSYSKIRK